MAVLAAVDPKPGHGDVHVCRKLAQGLVEVIHLGEDAADYQDDEDIGRRVGELVVSSKRHLERNAKGLDEHDGNGARRGADGEIDEGVLAAVLGRDLVDHEDAEDDAEGAVEEEAWKCVSLVVVARRMVQARTYQAAGPGSRSPQLIEPPCLAGRGAR